MKRFYQLSLLCLMAVCSIFTFSACGDNDSKDEENEIVSTPLIQRSCSLPPGSEVKASDLTTITLAYNDMVTVTNSPSITLNGKAVTAKNGNTRLEVAVSLELEDGMDYELVVPKGAIVKVEDNSISAPEFKISFRTKEAPVVPTPENNVALALTKKLGWGWNLGNHFDTSSGEDGQKPKWGYWDNATPSAELFSNLKKAGVSTVRIGVTWGNYQDAEWNIDANYMQEVCQTVDMAEAAGLNVIINLHHDEYWLDIKGAASISATNDNLKSRIEKTWKQIAEAMKDKGEFLYFESFNELQDGGWGWGDNLKDGGKQYRVLNEWNQLVVNTIRATGGNNATRWIGVPGYASNPSFVLDKGDFVVPSDPANHIMVSVHFYDPNTFTLTPENGDGKSEWGHTAANGKYQPGSNEEHVVDIFSKLFDKYIQNNIPVYIGEYGCVMHKNDRSNLFREYYLEYVCRAAHTYGMSMCIWDNNQIGGGNEHHGYFNHSDGTYLNNCEPLVQTMIKAATSDDASYTLDTVYGKAPK